MSVKIKTKLRLNETDSDQNLIRPDVIRIMEQNIAKEIEITVEKAWTAIQKAGRGCGEALRHHHEEVSKTMEIDGEFK